VFIHVYLWPNAFYRFIREGVIMAKFTTTISEDTRQRIHALQRKKSISDFMRKAINIFVEELENNPELEPENFIITVSARKDKTYKFRG
jgi:hypothetical protein